MLSDEREQMVRKIMVELHITREQQYAMTIADWNLLVASLSQPSWE